MIEVRNPENGNVIGRVNDSSSQDALDAVKRAKNAAKAAKAMPTHQRMKILNAVAESLERDSEEYAKLISEEGIKTIREARKEVTRAVDTLKLCAEEARRLTGSTIAFDQAPGSEDKFGYSLREPVGLIVAITPFNDPLNLVLHKVAPAIAGGNVIILKPHDQTPLTALKIEKAFHDAGLPKDNFQVITGRGVTVGDTLVRHPCVRMVSFTGGMETGKKIIAAAGFKKMSLELGGNCPTIVMADADIKKALNSCLSGAYWASGQNCVHVQRLLLHRDIYNTFKTQFVEMAKNLKQLGKHDENSDLGCMVSEDAVTRVMDVLKSATEEGARILTGGTCEGTNILPTIIEAVPVNHTLMKDEIFGPVTVLIPFDDLEEAISIANDVDFGLQAGIFTSALNTVRYANKHLEAGAVMINESSDYRIDAMPFGGVKGSGIGREGVRSTLLDMTEVKVVCEA
ncbi:MAG: aldehyde dehydrogenase family protein [Emcibacteraceae bacterium]|nr:aldehyde dehydrogenase family protein [Emcibacteraceae bacterium]